MPTGNETIARPTSSCKGDNAEQEDWCEQAPSSAYLRHGIEKEMVELLQHAEDAGGSSRYEEFEADLIKRIYRLGRRVVALFLCLWEERTPLKVTETHGECTYRRQPAKSRCLGTFFGKVRYWRSYLHALDGGSGGYYPVDVKLGLLADGFSLGTLSRAVQLATKMSYSAATTVFKQFVGWSPSHKTLEETTLGLGSYTELWRQKRPPMEGDGEVVVIQVDGKSPPTARQSELKLRRQPNRERPNKELSDSPRHRGRHRRWRRGSKRRRKKGDKSKNGRMSTVVVMYTLKQGKGPNGEPVLKGPVNRWVYASFAPKRHAFEVARQEADKRGFSSTSGKQVQIVTDGDEDYQRYIEELFPEAEHTLDVIHVIEYLWKAGVCLYREGSKKLDRWVEQQKEHLYKGEAEQIVDTLRTRLKGKLSKNKKKRLQGIIDYMSKRLHMMNYDELADDDLELASGIVEGAVRYVVSQRFDEGGMRWIPERAEALLQLRCIEINGEWEQFVSFVHERIRRKQSQSRRLLRLRQSSPDPLPSC